jgi:hypothetical protein
MIASWPQSSVLYVCVVSYTLIPPLDTGLLRLIAKISVGGERRFRPDRGVSRCERCGSPTALNLTFLDRILHVIEKKALYSMRR